MSEDSILEIAGYGAWNGGTVVPNSIYENTGMTFKGDQPVNSASIEKRIGVRTRRAAGPDDRIGVIALQDLLESNPIDPARIKVLIGATNIGEDRRDPGPLSRTPFRLIEDQSPGAMVFDLYAGCPGFNVASELVFVLSLCGILEPGDLSVVIGAENIHRAQVFPPLDTANIIFGDDALATALETRGRAAALAELRESETRWVKASDAFVETIAAELADMVGRDGLDGLVVDNQFGLIQHRVPAIAVRIQQRMLEILHPAETEAGLFEDFRKALAFYDEKVNCFAFDIMSRDRDPALVRTVAAAYVKSGKYNRTASVYLEPDGSAHLTIHEGRNGSFVPPGYGVVDSLTRTHGCFASYIEFNTIDENGEHLGAIDGKGVFLYATRGARALISSLLEANGLTMDDIELLIEHQANFAMIPLTLEKVLFEKGRDMKALVADYVANRMVNNIHERGNCSVVCMQRLPYDLERGALKPDVIHGYEVNKNVEALAQAKLMLFDSVGAGMTRSSFLYRKR